MEEFVGAKFYCSHVLAHDNLYMWIGEKKLKFSSTVLSTLSPYLWPSGSRAETHTSHSLLID